MSGIVCCLQCVGSCLRSIALSFLVYGLLVDLCCWLCVVCCWLFVVDCVFVSWYKMLVVLR